MYHNKPRPANKLSPARQLCTLSLEFCVACVSTKIKKAIPQCAVFIDDRLLARYFSAPFFYDAIPKLAT